MLLIVTVLSVAVARTAQAGAANALVWSPCSDVKGAECSGILVPVDPGNPKGDRFRLRLALWRATDPAHKNGVLIFIPGGPGVGIAGIFGSPQMHDAIADLRRRYEVVTFDPRGVGLSGPIRCAPSAVPAPDAPSATPPTRAQFDAIRSRNAALFRSCFKLSGAMMAHLSSIETAADIEQIRQALTPNEGLVAYGGSYGTQYGATYLEQYPTHVKRLVLDGLVDHSIDQPTDVVRGILATRDAFARLSAWCARSASCALHGKNVNATFDAAVRKVPATQILVPLMLAAGRDPHVGWPAIAKMIAEASRGEMTTLNALKKVSAEARGGEPEDPQVVAGQNGLYAGVICADFGPTNDYDALLAQGQTVAREAPQFTWRYWDSTPLAHSTAGALDCTGWPYPATNPPRELHVGPHPNVLVATAAHDPSTASANALAVHRQIPGSALLVVDADGHQSLVQSASARAAMIRFWSAGDPPELSAAQRAALDRIGQTSVSSHFAPSVVIAVERKGRNIYWRAFGSRTWNRNCRRFRRRHM